MELRNFCREWLQFFFLLNSNDYWSPTMAPPTFTTYDGMDHLWYFNNGSQGWQGSPLSGAPGEDISSMNADPQFQNPNYPFDMYQIGNTGLANAINFNIPSFLPTYTAGRTNPLIFAPPIASGLPLQLLSPFQF